jgi:hypothetical protein
LEKETMQDDTPDLGRVEWRNLLQFDAKAITAIGACALLLIGLLWVLPAWLHRQEHADFAGAAVQTASGTVTTVQISPVTQGGGGLFNGVTVAFDGHQNYYALPRTSKWAPKPGMHQKVTVKYRVGRSSGAVKIDSVTPD